MSKRQCVAAVSVLSPDVIRHVGTFLGWEDYAHAAQVCKGWRLSLERDLDLKRPWFAILDSYSSDMQLDDDEPYVSTNTEFSERVSTNGLDTSLITYIKLRHVAMVPYRFRHALVGLDPDGKILRPAYCDAPVFYVDMCRMSLKNDNRRQLRREYLRELRYWRDYARRLSRRMKRHGHSGRLLRVPLLTSG